MEFTLTLLTTGTRDEFGPVAVSVSDAASAIPLTAAAASASAVVFLVRNKSHKRTKYKNDQNMVWCIAFVLGRMMGAADK